MYSRVKPKDDMIYGVRAANRFEIDGNFFKIFEVGEVIQKGVWNVQLFELVWNRFLKRISSFTKRQHRFK